jgi:hypothetical protein
VDWLVPTAFHVLHYAALLNVPNKFAGINGC